MDALRTIGGLLDHKARKNGDKVYLYYEDKTISYEELKEQVDCLSGGFLSVGLRPGDKCYILLPNCPEYIFCSCALAKIGVVTVLINFNLKGKTLSRVVRYQGIHTLIVSSEYFENVCTIKEQLGMIEKVIVLEDFNSSLPECISHAERFNFKDLLEAREQTTEVNVGPSDPMTIIFTSGTTDYPKGVVCPHNMVLCWAEATAQVMRLTPDDIWYNVLPLYHGDGHFRGIFGPMVSGASLVLRRKFSASAFWDEIRRYHATTFSFIGAMLVILHNLPLRNDDDENPATRAAGAPIPEHLHLDFEKRFNIKLINEYGMSEIGNIMAVPYDVTKLKTAGKVLDEWQAKIFDNNDEELPPNKVGELVVRPLKPYMMMNGYYNEPEKTLKALRNLWFHTGDLGFFDEDGYFYFVDRAGDSLRVKGENISSVEMEEIVLTCPSVSNCAIIGVPSDLSDNDILLVVELKSGVSIGVEGIRDFCNENLPKYMVPRFIRCVKKIPLTEMEKINKKLLREEGITKDTWDSQKNRRY